MTLTQVLKYVNAPKYGTIANRVGLLQFFLFKLEYFLKREGIERDLLKELIQFNSYATGLIRNEPLFETIKFDAFDCFKESLLSVYPKFGTIKGKLYPLITGDLDKLFEDYAKKIGYSIDTHKEVLEIVQWAKDKELLNIGIEKFILSYYWESLKELRGKDDVTSNMIADDF